MSNIFNSPVEMSLRILLILNNYKSTALSSDRITYIDFITVHGAVFNVSSTNLHGENIFKFSEIAARRELVQDALNILMFKNLINVHNSTRGFSYSITESGASFSQAFQSNYSKNFRKNLKNTYYFIENLSDKSLFNIINEYSLKSLKKGGNLND